MKAGELRQLIDIEQRTDSRSSSGAVVGPPWTLFATVRAKITTAPGKEIIEGGEFLSQPTHVVSIRYLPGLTPSMRINFKTDAQRVAKQNGRLFDILGIVNIDERNREIDLSCRESTRSHGI